MLFKIILELIAMMFGRMKRTSVLKQHGLHKKTKQCLVCGKSMFVDLTKEPIWVCDRCGNTSHIKSKVNTIQKKNNLSFKFECPHCSQSLKIDKEMLEDVAECPTCGKSLKLSHLCDTTGYE